MPAARTPALAGSSKQPPLRRDEAELLQKEQRDIQEAILQSPEAPEDGKCLAKALDDGALPSLIICIADFPVDDNNEMYYDIADPLWRALDERNVEVCQVLVCLTSCSTEPRGPRGRA